MITQLYINRYPDKRKTLFWVPLFSLTQSPSSISPKTVHRRNRKVHFRFLSGTTVKQERRKERSTLPLKTHPFRRRNGGTWLWKMTGVTSEEIRGETSDDSLSRNRMFYPEPEGIVPRKKVKYLGRGRSISTASTYSRTSVIVSDLRIVYKLLTEDTRSLCTVRHYHQPRPPPPRT